MTVGNADAAGGLIRDGRATVMAMGVLKPEDMGGAPLRVGCDLDTSSGACDGGGAENQPVCESEFQNSFGARAQPGIDRARRVVHSLGLRPYRVYMIWQQRIADRTWRVHHKFELMPVRVLTMDSLEITASDWGENLVGGVSLTEISPRQVDEDALRGHLDGENWASKSTEREFFYEIQMNRRCPDSELEHRRRRFYPASEPFYDATSFEWMITVGQQNAERSRDGVDQTIGTVNPDGTPLQPGPRLVT